MIKKILLIMLVFGISVFYIIKKQSLQNLKPINIGIISAPDEFDPTKVHETHTGMILNNICGKLFNTSQSLEIENDLVKTWSISKDRKTYNFELNNRAFRDGSDVYSEDIYFTLLRASKNANWLKSKLSVIRNFDKISNGTDISTGFKIKDNKHFEISLDEPNPNFLYMFSHESFCILKNNNPFIVIDNFEFPNSPGKYRVESFKNKILTLKNHLENQPDLKLKFIKSEEAIEAFNRGEIDDLSNYLISIDDSRSIKRKFNEIVHPFYFTWSILFNSNSKIFQNIDNREIASKKFNSKKFLNLWNTTHIYATGLVPKGFKEHLQEPLYDFNDDGRKIRCEKEVVINTINGIENEKIYKSYFLNWMENLGCKAKVESLDINEYLKRLKNQEGDVFFHGLSVRIPDPLNFFEMFYSMSSNNDLKFSNDKFDNLYLKAFNQRNVESDGNNIQLLERTLKDLFWIIPISYPVQIFYSDIKLEGHLLNPLSMANARWDKLVWKK